jgi:hypothetical protein
MHLLSAGEVCRVLGTASGEPFSMKTLDNWCRDGVVTPIVNRGGHGNHRIFGVMEVLAIAIGRGMVASGFTLQTAAGVMRVVKGFSEEQLLTEFAQRKTGAVFLGEHVYGKLMNKQEADEAGKEFVSQNPEMFSVTGLRPQAIDIKRVYDNIIRIIEAGGRRSKVMA